MARAWKISCWAFGAAVAVRARILADGTIHLRFCISKNDGLKSDIPHDKTQWASSTTICVIWKGKDFYEILNLYSTMSIITRIVQNAYILNISPANPIELYQKAGLIIRLVISCVRVCNPVKDLDAKDTYIRNFLNSIQKIFSFCHDTSHYAHI